MFAAILIVYYQRRSDERSDPVYRTEELYHRLALGHEESILEERWIPDAKEGLASHLDEFSARSNVFLRSVLQLPIEDELLARAVTETWEREAVRRADEHVAREDAKGALEELRARHERSGWPTIIRLEANVLETLDRDEELDDVYRKGLEAALGSGRLEFYVEIALAAVRSLESRKRLRDALETIGALRSVAERSLSDERRLRVDLAELRIRRKLEARNPELDQIERRAAEDYLSLDDEQLSENISLTLQAAAELGEEPKVLGRALEVSPPLPVSGDQASLDRYTQKLEQSAAEVGLLSHEVAAVSEAAGRRGPSFLEDELSRSKLARSASSGTLPDVAVEALLDLYRLSV